MVVDTTDRITSNGQCVGRDSRLVTISTESWIVCRLDRTRLQAADQDKDRDVMSLVNLFAGHQDIEAREDGLGPLGAKHRKPGSHRGSRRRQRAIA